MSADDLNPSFDLDELEDDSLELQPDGDDPSANRPADGARHATPGEVLFEGYSGSEDAGDFLGLDTELHFSSEAGQNGHVDTQFDPSRDGGEGLELEPASDPDAGASEQAEGQAEAGHGYEDEAYDEDDHDEADLDESEVGYDDEEGGGPHKGVLVLSALCVGALVVVGALFGPGLIEKYTGTDATPVASTGGTAPRAGGASIVEPGGENGLESGTVVFTADSGDGAATGATDSSADDPFFASADGTVTPPVKNGERGSLQRLFSGETFSLVPRVSTGGALDRPTVSTTVADGGSTKGPAVDVTVPGDVAIPFPGVGSDAGSSVDETLFTAGIDWASQGDVDIVWRREEIPMDAIDAPTRVATPRIGTVRVHLHDGAFFEGRLIALGEGHAWIQTAPGRMAFEADSIASIESLGLELDASDPGAINAPLRGERVRVRAPGGLIYGHVVSQTQEGQVTLRTDDGGKVTLANAQVEQIGKARAVIVEN